jgi:hypothetical protein
MLAGCSRAIEGVHGVRTIGLADNSQGREGNLHNGMHRGCGGGESVLVSGAGQWRVEQAGVRVQTVWILRGAGCSLRWEG